MMNTPTDQPALMRTVTFFPGLPGPQGGPCLFQLDDGSIHAGTVKRSTETFPSGALITTNMAGGPVEVFEIPLHRVVGGFTAGRPQFQLD